MHQAGVGGQAMSQAGGVCLNAHVGTWVRGSATHLIKPTLVSTEC